MNYFLLLALTLSTSSFAGFLSCHTSNNSLQIITETMPYEWELNPAVHSTGLHMKYAKAGINGTLNIKERDAGVDSTVLVFSSQNLRARVHLYFNQSVPEFVKLKEGDLISAKVETYTFDHSKVTEFHSIDRVACQYNLQNPY